MNVDPLQRVYANCLRCQRAAHGSIHMPAGYPGCPHFDPRGLLKMTSTVVAERAPPSRRGHIIPMALVVIVGVFLAIFGYCGVARAQAMVLATEVVPNLVEDLRYATPNNFLKRAVYTDHRCWLRPSVARKLAVAARLLHERRPGWRLKVLDCARPRAVQRKMWAIMPDPKYVADPAKGSRHNTGSAVDLTIVDDRGREVEMPTGFDEFTRRAWADATTTPAATKNRALLREVMLDAGFVPLRTEWWHFEG
ncbi:MAG: M15 family metallopeptidase [bacterium]|nr:M15 family metallopeptidase [bacterium]